MRNNYHLATALAEVSLYCSHIPVGVFSCSMAQFMYMYITLNLDYNILLLSSYVPCDIH